MDLIFALLLIIGGALGAATLIIAKQPNARDLIGKLVPFQGIIGIALLISALIEFVWILRVLGAVFQSLNGILVLLAVLVGIALGFLLGYGLLNQYVLSKNADAARGGGNALASIAKYQAPLGIAGILLGIWFLIQYMRYM